MKSCFPGFDRFGMRERHMPFSSPVSLAIELTPSIGGAQSSPKPVASAASTEDPLAVDEEGPDRTEKSKERAGLRSSSS